MYVKTLSYLAALGVSMEETMRQTNYVILANGLVKTVPHGMSFGDVAAADQQKR